MARGSWTQRCRAKTQSSRPGMEWGWLRPPLQPEPKGQHRQLTPTHQTQPPWSRVVVGSPTDTPGTCGGCRDQPCCKSLPRAPDDSSHPCPKEAPSKASSRDGFPGNTGTAAAAEPVTLSRGDEPPVPCHPHPAAASPRTWQEEARSELGSSRGQCSGHWPHVLPVSAQHTAWDEVAETIRTRCLRETFPRESVFS